MKKMYKLPALLLSIMMVVFAFTACAGSNGNSSTTDSSKQNSSNSGNNSSAAQSPVSEGSKEDAPSGDRVTLRVSVYDRGTTTAEFGSVSDNKYTKWIQENFGDPNNIDVEFVPLPRTDSDVTINTWMASQSAPDIILTYDLNLYQDFALQGGLAELDDAIANNAPNMNKLFGPELLDYGKIDGVQYSIWAKRAALDITGNFIRKDWMDKAGLELRTDADGLYTMSIEELEEALAAFRDNDFDGTGQDIFAMAMSGSEHQYRSVRGIVDAFLNKAEITDEIYKAYERVSWPGHKDAVRWLNKQFNDGMMDTDYGTTNDTARKAEAITTGRSGFWSDDSWFQVFNGQALDALHENNPDAEVVAFRLENVHGEMIQEAYDPTAVMIMIPSFSERVNEAVMYLDFLCDVENDRVLRYGFEGENYTMKDGIPTDMVVDYINLSDYALMYNGDPDKSINDYTVISQLSEFVQPIRQATLTLGAEGALAKYNFPVPITAASKYNTDLTSKRGELYVNSIMASPEDFDTVYDKYYDEYLSIGGQQVIDEKLAVLNGKQQ